MGTDTGRQQGIKSIEVGMKILKEIITLGRPATLSELAQVANMHPAKIHRYLVSWIREGFVAQSPDDSRYGLGPYALEFSVACLDRLNPGKIGSGALESLANQTNESVILAIWGPAGPTVLDWQSSPRPVSVSTRMGTVFSLLMSSTGRVFAAYLANDTVSPLIDKALDEIAQSDIPSAPRTRQEVDEILNEVRDKGIALGIGIHRPGINSFSAPVFDNRSELRFVLTVFGYEDTFDTSWGGPIETAIRDTAELLSRQLGWPGP